MTEEEETENLLNDLNNLLEDGTDDDKFKFAIENTLALCESMDICPHCLAMHILEIMKQEEIKNKEAIH